MVLHLMSRNERTDKNSSILDIKIESRSGGGRMSGVDFSEDEADLDGDAFSNSSAPGREHTSSKAAMLQQLLLCCLLAKEADECEEGESL
jgi:hypothetical protein